ncbi:hypothetical protein ACOMHN_043850 [Nucella lapillus]
MRSCGTICLLLALLHQSQGQGFQLFFGTKPTSGSPLAPGVVDPNCADKYENCAGYGVNACAGQYAAWARDNCALTCKFCTGPQTTPPPCVDVMDNCHTFQTDACTNPEYKAWAQNNCRRFCRMCPAEVLAQLDALTTTLPPSQCVDKLDCRLYGQSSCRGKFESWAKSNCMNFCGFCKGQPTTAKPCLDSRPNCADYDKDMCTNPSYKFWADDNCPHYCGRCSGGR